MRNIRDETYLVLQAAARLRSDQLRVERLLLVVQQPQLDPAGLGVLGPLVPQAQQPALRVDRQRLRQDLGVVVPASVAQ